jgi:hypothetical protein
MPNGTCHSVKTSQPVQDVVRHAPYGLLCRLAEGEEAISTPMLWKSLSVKVGGVRARLGLLAQRVAFVPLGTRIEQLSPGTAGGVYGF